MITFHNAQKYRWQTAVAALGMVIVPWALAHAEKSFQDRRVADPQGLVELVAVTGSYEVSGADAAEVTVAGTTGSDVDRVEITSSGSRTSIHVVARVGSSWGGTDTHLVIHIPSRSEIKTSLVSANLKITGVQGNASLQSVSGDLNGEVGGDLRASTVSGTLKLTAKNAHTIEVKSISGDIHVIGGSSDAEVTTVSGDAHIALAAMKRGRFKSVSGDVSAELGSAADAQIDGQSVSGKIQLDFASAPPPEFDVQTFSGEIVSCFGPKPVKTEYGPGSRFSFKNGEGRGRVRIETQSGEVRLCDKAPEHAASLSAPRGRALCEVSAAAVSPAAIRIRSQRHSGIFYVI